MGGQNYPFRVLHGKKKIKLAASIINKLEEIPVEAVYGRTVPKRENCTLRN
jgi:hypothetical protein